jgi:dipeptidyl aminopeptidase/acylaminoacyl peptidase
MRVFAKIPILVLFGDNIKGSPRWAPRLKQCRAFVHAANIAGINAELILLPEVGIHGNSHMMMQDKNNLQVADWMLDWIGKHVGEKK